MQNPSEESANQAGVRFTVYDPFAEALYCRRTFEEAQRDADKIGCSLIIEVRDDDILSPRAVICRYRKDEDQWRPEPPPARPPAARNQRPDNAKPLR